jgi:hypothetical protein
LGLLEIEWVILGGLISVLKSRCDVAYVPEHCHPIAETEDLLHPVRDIDHADALTTETPDRLEK